MFLSAFIVYKTDALLRNYLKDLAVVRLYKKPGQTDPRDDPSY
jgi:hypothetical protein